MHAGNNIMESEITYLKGVGPQRAAILQKELNIFSFNDLLTYFPFRYVDKSSIHKIAEVRSELTYVQLKGQISNLREVGEGKAKRLVAELADDSGSIDLIWFKGHKWVREFIKSNIEYTVFGKPSIFKSTFNIVHPEIELSSKAEEQNKKVLFQPVYSTSEKLSHRGLDSRGIMRLQIELRNKVYEAVEEILPDKMLHYLKLMPRAEAYRQIHFPSDMEILEKARNRLKFEELLLLQLELLSHKWKREAEIKGHIFSVVGDYFNSFFNRVLPFSLTEAQKRVIREIRNDMRSGKQMNRLIQGDVGSGKTIVALMSMLIALDNAYQSALMAPTEVLATQHYQTISALTDQIGLKTALLTGSTKQAERKRIFAELESGELNLLIGTHALLEDKVRFQKLGLAVIDEQHRFGVAQRATFWQKNQVAPHILVMTATPIPRTLAMAFYGDLDTSVIDELPPGRKEIITKHFFENKRTDVYQFLKSEIAQGRQVYIVYPLIEESEKLDYKNLMDGYEHLSEIFKRPDYSIGIVHGKLKSDEKEAGMKAFKEGKTHILVSTTVIEVGVDVPNASVMLIESAERFGLSQLHQLRGRVGRGSSQSYCLLMSSHKLSHEARVRLETMVTSNDGFKIADVDLQLRGPGDIAGTQQSGIVNFKIANLATDYHILKAARSEAFKIMENDPRLESEENSNLRNYFLKQNKNKFNWSRIS